MATSMVFLMKGKDVLIGYKTSEVSPEELDGYRMREAIMRHVPVEQIGVCFEEERTYES